MCRGSAPLRLTRLRRNGKKVADRLLSRTCGLLGDSCGPPEPSGRDADETLEVMRERALVRKPGVGGDLRQGEVAASLQELLRPFDAARDHVLVRRHPGGRLELPGEVVGAEPGDRGQLLQSRTGVEVLSMYSTTARSRPRGSVPSRPRSGRRGAWTCRIRWTARTLANDSAASRPPAPVVNSASTAPIAARNCGSSKPSSSGTVSRAGSRSNAWAATRATNPGSR
jgi:hypothetical protein